MKKTAVYSWRISPDTKAALEIEARREGESVAALLERVTREWLKVRRRAHQRDRMEQARLHAAMSKLLGAIRGGDPARAERSRSAVRARLARRRAR
jgi:hypothetical protein